MTTKPSIRVARNAEELSRRAADHFLGLAVEAVRKRKLFTVALAGGSTPQNLYCLLASRDEPFREKLPWNSIHFFWGDERHVSPDHPDSNFRMAWETLLSKVPVPNENVHRIRGENTVAVTAADEYEATLRQIFDLAEGHAPRFDLILLGVGSDAHIASIFPGSPVIKEKKRLVAAPWVESLQSSRITLTPPVLNNAAVVIFLVTGGEKAKALREIVEGNYDPERFPAQMIKANKGRVLWLVDQQAAMLLHSHGSLGN